MDLERNREQCFSSKDVNNADDDFVVDKDLLCKKYADNRKVQDWICYSEEEAYGLYRSYAQKVGFSIRKEHTSYYPNSRKIKDKDYVCSKSGFKKDLKPNANCKYQKAVTRTGCNAMIRFMVDDSGVWSVKKFIECHNHEFAKIEDTHLLRSFRSIDIEKASVLSSMNRVGIRTVDAYGYLAEELGGFENVGFSKRDAYNYIQNEKRKRFECGDTTSLLEIFRERQSNDSMFYWDVQFDNEQRLYNLFWVDGGGRIDYDCFGDVIIFDTSYRLNKYNLACAPIVGVNNHWQNIMIGVAFLSDETIESFTWLFESFKIVMRGKQPQTIFTDQDQAMARAIELAFPHSSHRLCQWHIMKKAPSKVSCFNSNKTARNLFFKCFKSCDSELEFDEAWSEMILKGDLQNHQWLEDLHKIRHKWSTAFNKNTFSCGIHSTQRSESTNNVCHGISKPTSSITDCFLGLERIMINWRRNECDEDHRCSQSDIAPIVKSSPILKQASQFYSKRMFSFFQASL